MTDFALLAAAIIVCSLVAGYLHALAAPRRLARFAAAFDAVRHGKSRPVSNGELIVSLVFAVPSFFAIYLWLFS